MNKFEQLIEFVINDEEAKARALFHDIVVEKSRQIYEDIMAEETEEVEEAVEELDEAAEEEIEEGDMGGDAADDLIDDVEAEEEQDMSMEAEGDNEEVEVDGEEEVEFGGDDHHDDVGGDEELEDRVLDLESKLDELMAEFEELMGDEVSGDGDDFGADEGGDAIEVDDTEEMLPMAEGVSLKAAPKPVTSEEGSVNKKSTVAANAGAKGPVGSTVKPVTATGTEAKGRPAPTAKDLVSDFQNKAGVSMKDQKSATKPHTAQASGVNTKSVVPGSHS